MAVGQSEEEVYLEGLKGELGKEADKLLKKMGAYSDSSREAVKYIWDNKGEFDEYGYEAFNSRVSAEQLADAGEKAGEQFKRLMKMMDSPYFARIDFLEEEGEALKVYIGKFPFWSAQSVYEVYDWRSPVASMYYEFDDGPAWYDAPMGKIEGVITCKRQYKIRRGVLEYVLESSVSIDDEILQRELSRTSDSKMKDIVATIQKEQNRLIRNESAQVLIVQGVAGSGKTSIALHRVAYFLYRYKNEITSDNFLFISPNGVFVDYVSDVLPELGEAKIRCMDMEDIADAYLGKGYRFERLCGQAERYLLAGDDDWARRCRFKSTPLFLEKLEEFLAYCDEHSFVVEDYVYERGRVEGEFISKCYRRNMALPVRRRLQEVAAAIWEEIRSRNKTRAEGVRKMEIMEWLDAHFRCNDAMSLYEDFYRHIGRGDMFSRREGEALESADVFPLLYVKLYLEGCPGNEKIKHLIVDEMQDYSPVQYAVLNKLYPCRKTILGDFSQNVTPFAQGSLELLGKLYPQAQVIEMNKSYRSTFEIMEFARGVCRDVPLEPIKRHGERPALIRCSDREEEWGRLLELAKDFQGAAYDGGKLGVICKSYAQAQELYWWLSARLEERDGLHLFTFDSEEFYDGIMVTSVSMAKGLEFDQVIIPDVDEEGYHTEYDRGLLYVACTRAMHRLTLLCGGKASPIADNACNFVEGSL